MASALPGRQTDCGGPAQSACVASGPDVRQRERGRRPRSSFLDRGASVVPVHQRRGRQRQLSTRHDDRDALDRAPGWSASCSKSTQVGIPDRHRERRVFVSSNTDSSAANDDAQRLCNSTSFSCDGDLGRASWQLRSAPTALPDAGAHDLGENAACRSQVLVLTQETRAHCAAASR